ncbi:MAG: 23S rRNA (uracil(1939)-C(5))-methyltransferase RlmD [Candidatus Njordarchaeales archaeon]
MARITEVTIKDIDEKGFGIGYLDNGRVVRVPYALPGERVLVKIISRRGESILLKIIEESERRIHPLCPYFGVCGGCFWQHIKYEEQLRIKQEIVRKHFKKYESALQNIIGSKKIWRYRNKMEFSFGEGSLGTILGLKVRGRFDKVVNIDACLLQKQEADQVLRRVKKFSNDSKLIPYDPKNHTGFLRHLVIRTTFFTDQLMVNIITTSSGDLDIEKLWNLLEVDSLIWSINDSVADVAMGDVKKVFGSQYIEEKLLGLNFKIYPYSFFQTNPVQAEVMYKLVKNLAGSGNKALDLYSGIGVMALIIAENFSKVVGIEVVPEAIKAGNENAKINGINNVEFLEGKVEDLLQKIINEKVDLVITDPPRAGMHKKALQALAKMNPPKIIYVSCNPRTQKEDIEKLLRFTNNGYEVKLVQPIDMFPHTPHIENIVLLERKK